MDKEKYNIFISKILFDLLALFGFLFIFVAGMYWGYNFKQNEEYFNTSVKEIKIINYLNDKYTYNFVIDKKPNDNIYTLNIKYSEKLSNNINKVTIILTILGIIILILGFKFSYKYNKQYKENIKQFIKM